MRWKRVAVGLLPAVWTFSSLVVVEQAADYYYLIDNPAVFFTISGWRLPLFIIIAVTGSVAAGALLRNLAASVLSESAGIVLGFLTFYSFCDPRVCFSSGMDGLEPFRMGFFLVTTAVSGAALGMSIRGVSPTGRAQLLVGFCAFAAVAYFPVVFTFAGTRILWDLHPWAVLAPLAVAAFPLSVDLSLKVNRLAGLAVPTFSLLVLILLSSGIAAAYLATLATVALLMVCTAAVASACGVALVAFRRKAADSSRRSISVVYVLGLVFVLATMLVSVPDAVSAVVPSAEGSPSGFTMGTPVYAGAYMSAPAGHALGAGVTVDFGSTNSSVIQTDNFLSGGIGIHAAGCCVDGIDYSYRFDVYLFHNGNESLAASAWEVCDDNAACGGHSWKSLMFLRIEWLSDSASGKSVTLRMSWVQSGVAWSYSLAGGNSTVFTTFAPPSAENRNFNTGVLEGGTLGPQQSGSYFFQFGIMSRHPIGHGGWNVELACPSILTTGWSCVDHAKTLTGGQSFWKVFWRWGEDYPDVSISAHGSDTVILQFATSATQSFRNLW